MNNDLGPFASRQPQSSYLGLYRVPSPGVAVVRGFGSRLLLIHIPSCGLRVQD